MLFGPFFVFGLVLGVIHEEIFVYGFVNPFSYSIGISLIVIVLKYDINDILSLVGFGKEGRLSLNSKYAKTIQEIGYLMGLADFDNALKKANALLKEEPDFVNALSLKGQILLEGFARYSQAREYLEKVLELTDPEEEQYKLAESLIVASYDREEE